MIIIEVIKHFEISGGESSSIVDEFSPPFLYLEEELYSLYQFKQESI